jgi:hypothetical protein
VGCSPRGRVRSRFNGITSGTTGGGAGEDEIGNSAVVCRMRYYGPQACYLLILQ